MAVRVAEREVHMHRGVICTKNHDKGKGKK